MIVKPFLGRQLRIGHPLARGLVGCWLMNEGGGNKVFDLSGNGNAGTFFGNTHWVPGKHGPCLSFDGTGDYVQVPDNTNNRPGTSNWAISLWFWAADANQSAVLICKRVTSSPYNQMGIYISNGGLAMPVGKKLNFVVIGTDTINDVWWYDTSSQIVNGNWHHVVFVRTQTDGIVYVDGISQTLTLVRDSNTEPQNINNTQPWQIAQNNSGVQYFNGLIDNVIIFTRALAAAEIQQLYREPFCMFKRERIELWSAASPAITGVTITPDALSGLLTLQTPVTNYDFTVLPDVLSALATLQTANINIGIVVSPVTGVLSATLIAPQINYDLILTPTVLSALATLESIGINYDFLILPNTVAGISTLQNPQVNYDSTTTPDTTVGTFTLQSPQINYDFVISPNTLATLLTLQTIETHYDYVTAISVALSLISSLQTPTISTGVNITVTPNTGLLNIVCEVPVFTYDYLYDIAASLNLTCYQHAPTIPVGRTYIVYDETNHYLSIFVEGTEVARLKSDGSIDVNTTVNQNAF